MKFPDLDGFFVGARWKPCVSNSTMNRNVARIMGTIEHYVIARYPRCVPFVMHYRDFASGFERVPSLDPKPRKLSR